MAGLRAFEPEIVELPGRLMAVVTTVGDPEAAAGVAFRALFGAAYTLRSSLRQQAIDYAIPHPCARWFGGADWVRLPRSSWRAAWGIEVPPGTREVAQKVPDVEVALERWEYGMVAQVLHVGTYAEEAPSIEKLHAFIAERGYEVAGPHEEEYWSRPEAKHPKTVIRYQVRPL